MYWWQSGIGIVLILCFCFCSFVNLDLISSCRSFVGFETALTLFLQVSQILMVPQHYFCFFLGWWFRVDPPLWRGRRLRVQSRRRPTRPGSSPQPGIRGASPTLIWNCVRTANYTFSYTPPARCLFVSFLYIVTILLNQNQPPCQEKQLFFLLGWNDGHVRRDGCPVRPG